MLKYLPLMANLILLSAFIPPLKAQKVDSIFFHLYTDSLKKGTYNYINVDGKMHDGRWFPLSGNLLVLTSTGGRFDGNSLILDSNFHEGKVTVTAKLKADTTVMKSVTIYLKTQEDNEPLKTKEEIMREVSQPKPRKKGNR